MLTTESGSKRRKLSPPGGLFEGLCFYLLPAGNLSKVRRQLFYKQITKHNGHNSNELDSSVTHIIVDEKFDWEKTSKILKSEEIGCKVIRSSWLSDCLRLNELLPSNTYEIHQPPAEVNKEEETIESSSHQSVGGAWIRGNTAPSASIDDESDYIDSDDDEQPNSQQSLESSPRKQIPKGNWTCAQSSKQIQENMNQQITEKLEQMIRLYEAQNDRWRAFGYQKAVSALKKHPTTVSTWEEAMAIPGIGKKLADKIWEIIESGELRKLDELSSSEDTKILQLFSDVWGAGPITARKWFQMGLRTLDDLKLKGTLTRQQQIGLRHYDDLLDRMPRSEAAEIESVVKKACMEIDSGLISMACGSYRRGKSTCGDVDILVTHPDGKSHKGVFTKLLEKLRLQGFLTDDLVSQENTGNQKKYLGVCKLTGENTKHRRLDIIVVPYDEFGCALVYFTGSAHFNRSLRHLCKKQGMSLNEHALKVGVIRKDGEKINPGRTVLTPTEESVFQFLAVPYRPPEDRDH